MGYGMGGMGGMQGMGGGMGASMGAGYGTQGGYGGQTGFGNQAQVLLHHRSQSVVWCDLTWCACLVSRLAVPCCCM